MDHFPTLRLTPRQSTFHEVFDVEFSLLSDSKNEQTLFNLLDFNELNCATNPWAHSRCIQSSALGTITKPYTITVTIYYPSFSSCMVEYAIIANYRKAPKLRRIPEDSKLGNHIISVITIHKQVAEVTPQLGRGFFHGSVCHYVVILCQ